MRRTKLEGDLDMKRGNVSFWNKKKFANLETQLKHLEMRVLALSNEKSFKQLNEITEETKTEEEPRIDEFV